MADVGGIAKGKHRKKRAMRPAIDRFMEKIVIAPGGCWEWQACIARATGYGWFSFDSEPVLAHRWAYEHFVGEIPAQWNIDHLCRNRKCVNPKHLEAVTSAENTRRGELRPLLRWLSQTITHCKRGHEFSAENTTTDSSGHRSCKVCQRRKADEWRRNNRARVNYMQQLRRAACRVTTGGQHV